MNKKVQIVLFNLGLALVTSGVLYWFGQKWNKDIQERIETVNKDHEFGKGLITELHSYKGHRVEIKYFIKNKEYKFSGGRAVRLKLSYAGISCPCADWYEIKYADKESDLEYFYLEPHNTSLIQADTLFNGKYFPVHISVTGQFYTIKGYPKNYFSAKGTPKAARVFRYDNIEIIQRGKTVEKKSDL